VHIDKLPSVNSLKRATPVSVDLVFKLKRSRFVVETFHLPLEFADETVGGRGGATLPKKMDF